jgi:hypothetical protein
VYVIKNTTVGLHELNPYSTGTLQMQVYPNPNNGDFMVKFNLKNESEVKIYMHDLSGNLIETAVLTGLPTGENTYSKKIKDIAKGGIYYVTIETNYEKAAQKIIIDP